MADRIDLDELDHAKLQSSTNVHLIAATHNALPGLIAELREARALLDSIAYDPHCAYPVTVTHKTATSVQYAYGVADGHRCVAARVRAHLAKHTADPDGRRDLGQAELGRTGSNDAAGQPKETQ